MVESLVSAQLAGFWGPIRRVIVLISLGSLVVGLSCMAQFRSTSWIYDEQSGSSPLLNCPKRAFALQRDDLVDGGSFCEVKIYNWDHHIGNDYLSVNGPFGLGYNCWIPKFDVTEETREAFVAFSSRNPILCQVSKRCTSTRYCTIDQATGPAVIPCPRGPEEAGELSDLAGLSLMVSLAPSEGFYVDWSRYKDTIFTEYCDEEFKIPAGKIVAVRGLVAALLVLVLAWFIVDVGMHVSRPRGKSKTKNRIGADVVTVENEYNKVLIENIWPSLQRTPPTTVWSNSPRSCSGTPTVREGMVARTVTASPSCRLGSMTPTSFKVAVCEDPWKAFASSNWREKIERFHQEKLLKPIHGKSTLAKKVFVPVFLVVLASLIAWMFLALSPSDLVNSHSVADVIIAGYSSIERAYSTWVILPMLFLDELAELLFFAAICSVVRWGRKTVFANVRDKEDLESDSFDESSSSGTFVDSLTPRSELSPNVVHAELIPAGVVAVVCVDRVRIDDENRFIENIESVITVMGIEKVFVMQFSDSFAPLDDTATLLQKKINLGIQFLFVPERDKLASVYWFSKYYLPLVQLHQGTRQKFAISHVMVVDQTVHVPHSLAIPHPLIDSLEFKENGRMEKVGLICFGVSDSENPLENLDLKFHIVSHIFQSDRASLGDSEFAGALFTVWDRESLEFAAFDHSPMTEGNGGDFPGAGINLVRAGMTSNPDVRKIKFISNSLVHINNGLSQSTFDRFINVLFLKFARRKRLWFTDFLSLLSPASVFNVNRIPSKPVNLINLLSHVFDFIRLPVLFSSALRDPIGLGFILTLYICLQWIRVAVLSIAIIPSGSRRDRPALTTALGFPFFQLVCNLCLLKPLSIIGAVVWSVWDRPAQSLHEREDHEKTVPPCLPFPDAPWFSVWKLHQEKDSVLL